MVIVIQEPSQRVQSTNMVQSMVSIIGNFLYGLGKYSLYGYLGPFGHGLGLRVRRGFAQGHVQTGP